MRTTYLYIILAICFISCQHRSGKAGIINANEFKQTLLSKIPLCPVDTFIDPRDNNIYSLITIGKQTWTRGFIKYQPTKGKTFRKYLYNWDAALDACPQTFKIPSDSDWSELFEYVYDSIIKKSSPQLIEKLSENLQNIYCTECKDKLRKASLPFGLRIDSTIAKSSKYEYVKTLKNLDNEMVILFYFLEQIGFCTYGSGFKYQGGLGVDDYSYFWSSTIDNSGDHKYIPLYTGDYCQGCGYRFSMPYNNGYGFNLKCLMKH